MSAKAILPRAPDQTARPKIGIQGIEGSYSEQAARILLAQLGVQSYEIMPLLTAGRVIAALAKQIVQLGAVAIRNNHGGEVEETRLAFQTGSFSKVAGCVLPIRHCLYTRDSSVTADAVTIIVSHEQALRQCAENLSGLFPTASRVAIEDTAVGAARLAAGDYPPRAGVICSREAGMRNGLFLLYEKMEDREDNETEFWIIKSAMP
ncbi:MAG: hypothetical protein C4519_25950 [Desulfobacteraceae bacterium]|nr:MAG: hypothetical protein C4519_25950 [Desulfobacteraceae bacterium]